MDELLRQILLKIVEATPAEETSDLVPAMDLFADMTPEEAETYMTQVLAITPLELRPEIAERLQTTYRTRHDTPQPPVGSFAGPTLLLHQKQTDLGWGNSDLGDDPHGFHEPGTTRW